MQLRASEEDNLELDLMGQGFRPKFSAAHDIPGLGDFIPPRLDFAYGVCAHLTHSLATCVLATQHACTTVISWHKRSLMQLPRATSFSHC
jgi:hypothetical protein